MTGNPAESGAVRVKAPANGTGASEATEGSARRTAERRISSYRLAVSGERGRGGGVRFVRAQRDRLLDALGKGRVRFLSALREQAAAHAAGGCARASGKPGALPTHLGPG